jgi:DNA-binding response OmpR family regulator
MKVLIADDDAELRELIAFTLGQAGYLVIKASDGSAAVRLFNAESPDLVVLDINMPVLSGFQVCEAIRARSRVPVMMLTVRGEEEDLVRALGLGADDYLTKPFSPRELLARIRALLRRARAQSTVADAISKVRAYRFGGWELNIGLRKLRSPKGEAVELTKGEFSLLAAFLSAPQRILAREQLLDLSRLHNAEVYDRSIDVQILRLRRKIEADPSHPRFIVTERGVGYVFSSPVETVR